jgi:hypothetical protein
MENQVAKALSDLTQAMPKSRLISIVGIVEAVSSISNGELTVPELADALTKVYDGDTMMIYEGGGYGLAAPVIGNPFDEHSGHTARVDIVCDVFNSHFWTDPDTAILRRNARDYMVLKDDGIVIAQRLWAFFFPERMIDLDAAALDGTKSKNGVVDCADYLNPKHPRYAPKLAAAVRAWQAVTEPNGKHPKQALSKWLRDHAKEYGLVDDKGKPTETGIEEAAKVANWQPGGGAPKTPGR